MVASGQLRKLAKHTRAGRYRRVARRLDRLLMRRQDGGQAAASAVARYRDEAGRSLLHLAAADGHARLIRAFADLGCSLIGRDAHGNTPAHLILYHCLQAGRSPAYAERLLANLASSASPSPWPSLLAGLANASGATCRGLLDRLEGEELAASAAADAALADAPDEADDDDSDDEANWRRRLADAAVEDAGDAADWAGGVHDSDGDDDDGSPAFETLDDWFNRIGREYAERRRRQQQQQQRPHQGKDKEQQRQPPPRHLLQLQQQQPQWTEALDAYTHHKDAYVAFFQAPADSCITGVGDVPWPPFLDATADPADVLRALQASGLSPRSELRQLRVLWHPDKFLQKFGHRLSQGAREPVLRRVTLASQLVNGALALLLATAAGGDRAGPSASQS